MRKISANDIMIFLMYLALFRIDEPFNVTKSNQLLCEENIGSVTVVLSIFCSELIISKSLIKIIWITA